MTSSPTSLRPVLAHQRQLLVEIGQLAAACAADDTALRRSLEADLESLQRAYAQQRRAATAAFEASHAGLIRTYQEAREGVFTPYEVAGASLAAEANQVRTLQDERLAKLLGEAQTALDKKNAQIELKHTSREKDLATDDTRFQTECHELAEQLAALQQEARQVVARRISWPENRLPPLPLAPSGSRSECLARHAQAAARAAQWLVAISQERCSRFLEDGWLVLILIFAFLAAVYPVRLGLAGWSWILVLASSALFAVLLALAVHLVMRPLGRRRTARMVPAFQQAVDEAAGYLNLALEASRTAVASARRQYGERRERKLATAQAEAEATRTRLAAANAAERSAAAKAAYEKRRALAETHHRRLAELEALHPPRIERAERAFAEQLAHAAAAFQAQLRERRGRFEREAHLLAERWRAGLNEFGAAARGMNDYVASHFSAWPEPPQVSAETSGEAAIPLGAYTFSLAELPGQPLSGVHLDWPREPFSLPAAISYPESPSLLLEAEGAGREAATACLRNTMLRLLTAFPPGKVRFTILDPVGLGESFSAFMHLADYDERLVANRIWTEAAHIQQRLVDLTEHMENVIQKYLRNEYDSILAYNREAGEVAEPFQILVVANFPANFSEEAARRLVSIAASGPRCGVFTLISVDRRLALPRGFDMHELRSRANTLVWQNEAGRFAWETAELRPWPLTLSAEPEHERFTALVREVGEKAQGALRVEVPFATVLPAENAWWQACSRQGIEAPLGRAGAKKLQTLRLGKGTSQHVLVAGKTGSGKSTLLNSVITNLAAHYAPSELQFYLIDFKKGVEFKAYATHRLPHARVIAIESEREFGLSVLERLDQELRLRGDLFREAGVPDLPGYRAANPQAELPRILLIIDEFQEFFTSDDKISHESSLLLDRLVRQGRAFGIHLLLGSQTLAGAYTLARSTLGQMAVRIALQCSETDAHLILSEDNTAARLLSRPGEAIYNDANGLFEGNHPFQVVWLSDKERETRLRQIAQLARERGLPTNPATVFEGNVSANPLENEALCATLRAAAPVAAPACPRAWLGAAVAIKEPTSILFRRQGGANLLLVGQHEELAQGALHACLASLRAQLPPGAGQGRAAGAPEGLYVFDAVAPELPEAALWHRGMAGVTHVSPRNAASTVGQLAAEVERRQAGDEQAPPLFLFFHNLARFRELKKSDEFGLGSFDEGNAAQAAKQLATLWREGPTVGVHSLLWCDSYANLYRWVERASLRDLEMRVLFQMSAADASNLMDSPAASRLGPRMAYYFSEERGELEKFRPYGQPSAAWLTWLDELRRPSAAPGGSRG